ncbi:hypothetical protein CANARDRAFT_29389 [[Candida] arabinofermentans NRRL YB-2248]|uniref:Uncharacterized protein n=1 Tax=[Candida] arabinofermentans NRRL YB-2248 TaxID=983967 RepID=A0A1E4SXK7_9ASCO|nr:hypothetical protein CANARDRAFT_29389 [[Candida] arabinofermentans NRRL YB-2248]
MKEPSPLKKSVFESPFLSTRSPSSRSLSANLFENDNLLSNKNVTGNVSSKRSFSLLDDFESGNTDLDDIFDTPRDLKKPNSLDHNVDSDFLASCLPSLEFGRYLMKVGLDDGLFETTPDLDFSNVTKTTIEADVEDDQDTDEISDHEKFSEEIKLGEESKEQLDGLIGNLSLDELDMQVRSNHYNPMEDHHDNDHRIDDLDFGNELKKFLDSSPDKGRMILDEIFDHNENFDNLEFDNLDESSTNTDESETAPFNPSEQSLSSKQEIKSDTHFNSSSSFANFSSKNYRFALGDDLSRTQIYTDPTPFTAEQIYNNYIRESYMVSHSSKQLRSPMRICSPSTTKHSEPEKPTLKSRKNLLNLIVESSDGNLDDATKYATEINAINSTGIPIPEKTTELVTIPTSGPDIGGVKKSAIVKAILARNNPLSSDLHRHKLAGLKTKSNRSSIRSDVVQKNGFYTKKEQREFLKRTERSSHFEEEDDKENKRLKNDNHTSAKMKTISPLSSNSQNPFGSGAVPVKKIFNFSSNSIKGKKVTWATSLEW